MAGHQRTADTPAGGGQADTGGGALYYGWAYVLTLWGKGGYGHGGSPNAEAGKMPAPLFQVGTPEVFYTYFYNIIPPVVSALKNYYI